MYNLKISKLEFFSMSKSKNLMHQFQQPEWLQKPKARTQKKTKTSLNNSVSPIDADNRLLSTLLCNLFPQC